MIFENFFDNRKLQNALMTKICEIVQRQFNFEIAFNPRCINFVVHYVENGGVKCSNFKFLHEDDIENIIQYIDKAMENLPVNGNYPLEYINDDKIDDK